MFHCITVSGNRWAAALSCLAAYRRCLDMLEPWRWIWSHVEAVYVPSVSAISDCDGGGECSLSLSLVDAANDATCDKRWCKSQPSKWWAARGPRRNWLWKIHVVQQTASRLNVNNEVQVDVQRSIIDVDWVDQYASTPTPNSFCPCNPMTI